MISKLEKLGTVSLDKTFKQLTTIKVGGKIAIVFEPINIKALIEGIEIIKRYNYQFKIFGNGSNMLCSDKDYNGVIIKLNNLNHYEINDDELYAEAGAPIITIANFAINNGLSGLQFATGIPAFTGGAIYMNAGAYNESISDVIEQVLVYKDKRLIWLSKKDLDFQYRKSIFQNRKDWIIIAVNFKLNPDEVDRLKQIGVNRNKRRWESQPIKYPNFGSVFRNIEGYQVWKLVDELNLRGKQIGGAQVSEKHSNFIVNKDNALASDVDKLIKLVQEKAKTKNDIDLKLEVERFNW